MAAERFDVVVVGSGPGGEGAAMRAVKSGRSVALVERWREVGGGCTHWGTIPSKALRQTVHQWVDFRSNPLFKKAARAVLADFPELLRSAAVVISEQVRLRQSFYERNGVELIEGEAAFEDPNELRVAEAH